MYIPMDSIVLDQNNARHIGKISPDEIISHANNEIDLNQSEHPGKRDFFARIHELSQSIKEDGLLQPITVFINDDDKYELRAGERRYLAHLLLDMREIRALVRPKEKDPFKDRVVSLIENLQREDLTSGEVIKSIKNLDDFHNQVYESPISGEKLEKLISKSRRTCFLYLQVARSDEKIYQAVVNNEITLSQAREIIINGYWPDEPKNENSTEPQKNEPTGTRAAPKKASVFLGRMKMNQFSALKKIMETVNRSMGIEMPADIDWTDPTIVEQAWHDMIKKLSE